MDKKNETNILVRFTTKSDDYRVSENPFSLPSTVGRVGLSEVLNHLLELDEFVPFDFSINDHLLRSPLAKFISHYNISTEDILSIEYFPAITVPEDINSHENESWISSIRVLNDSLGCAGCYNGNILVFDPKDLDVSQNVVCHEEPIKSIALWENNNNYHLATSSKDYLIKIWNIDASNQTTNLLYNLAGHVNSVESVTQISLPGSSEDIILSGDWSGNLFGWKLPKNSNNNNTTENDNIKKKRKAAEMKKQEVSVDLKSFFTLKAHGQSVSSIYSNSSFSSIYTASWDHSFKQWDLDKMDTVVSVNCSKVITSLDCDSINGKVATAHPDGKVRIWDGKAKESSNVPIISLGKSTNWIAQVFVFVDFFFSP
jgi:ribosome biogenesis protein YTM1